MLAAGFLYNAMNTALTNYGVNVFGDYWAAILGVVGAIAAVKYGIVRAMRLVQSDCREVPL